MLAVRMQFVLKSTPILNGLLLSGENPSKALARALFFFCNEFISQVAFMVIPAWIVSGLSVTREFQPLSI